MFLYIAVFLLVTSCSTLTAQEGKRRYPGLISHDEKYVWFKVPKVGSSTIIYHLVGGDESWDQGFIHSFTQRIKYKENQFKGYFKFAFVRNPWDRVVSAYSKALGEHCPLYRECYGKGFDYFVDYIDRQEFSEMDRHIMPQSLLFPVAEMDFVGRLENFSEDLNYVLDRIGIQHVGIVQRNARPRSHYSEYYTERTRDIIARKYRLDIENFDYVFEKEGKSSHPL